MVEMEVTVKGKGGKPSTEKRTYCHSCRQAMLLGSIRAEVQGLGIELLAMLSQILRAIQGDAHADDGVHSKE